jgi:DNA-directed RNA polymerase specialized sigma24 family protein
MPRKESEFGYRFRIATALDSMPPLDHAVLELRFIQQFEFDFVASELGVSEAEAKRIAFEALCSLRERVNATGAVLPWSAQTT